MAEFNRIDKLAGPGLTTHKRRLATRSKSYLDLRCGTGGPGPRLRELRNARAARSYSRVGAGYACAVFSVALVQNKIKFGVYFPGLKKNKRRATAQIKRYLVFPSTNGSPPRRVEGQGGANESL